MSETTLITRDEAIAAIRRCGFTVQPDPDWPDDTNVGRTIVHSFAGGGGFALGCDLDADTAVAYVESCKEAEGVAQVAWKDTLFGRCLVVLRDDGRLLTLDTVTP